MRLSLDEATISQLLRYLQLLQKWNQVYNLTAVRDLDGMVHQHLLDSLSVLPWMIGERVIDVGSGAGFPGIPVALVRPQLAVTLLDSAEKKTAFLQQAVAELGLRNADVVRSRAEDWQPPKRYDVAVSRAFAELGEFVSLARHLVRHGGRLVAMKGVHPAAEMAQLPARLAAASATRQAPGDAAAGPRPAAAEVVPVTVPGLNAERHIVVITPEPEA
jgi:16S rRNA (guanine527-N7)-methyltransferase